MGIYYGCFATFKSERTKITNSQFSIIMGKRKVKYEKTPFEQRRESFAIMGLKKMQEILYKKTWKLLFIQIIV